VGCLAPHLWGRADYSRAMKVLGRIGAFELIDVLGRGGMGVVYRARHVSLERLVALKVIAAERSEDPGFRERFRREALAAAAVEHPHVVPVYDAGAADDVLYLAMRLIDGPDLRTVLAREGRLQPERAVRLLVQVAAALEAAHRRGVLHRDVKPSNVLVERSGADQHAYLSDFGLARLLTDAEPLTASGAWVGTPDFAAPEQLCGEPVDARTDVYALGCVLHQSLTGAPPFAGRDLTEKLCAKLAGALPPPLTDPGTEALGAVVTRALAREPERRYGSAAELASAMLAALRGQGGSTTSTMSSALPRVRRAETTHGLPPVPNPTIGREQDLASVTALLRQGERQLLTLLGPGGVGKTRLAIESVRALAAAFQDGAVLVPLAAAQPSADVAAAVCTCLDVRVAAGESAERALSRFLAPRRLLLGLDNVEHLTGVADLVAAILRACPAVTVLVTSQTPLDLAAERRYVVAPLALHGDGDGSEDAPAVELFLARARSRDPTLRLGPDDRSAVVEVCRRLDGLPLAIELAASATPLLAPAQLAERLANALSLPAAGARDAPERQRSLEAAFEWSYGLLSEDERVAFERFAVFVRGGTVAAAEQVTGATLDTLQSLLSKSLLTRRQDAGQPRLFMLQTVREYALRRLDARGDDVRLRHFEWALALAEQGEAELAGRNQATWLEHLDAERANCVAALAWSVDAGRLDLTLRLAGALAEYWHVRGGYAEGLAFLEAGLRADGDLEWERARAHAGLGHLAAFRLGDPDRGLRHLKQALSLFRQAGDVRRQAACVTTIATVEAALGRRAQAPATAARALRLARRSGDDRAVGLALLSGVIAARDFAEGKPLLEEGVALLRRAGDAISLGDLLDNAGYLALIDGEREEARSLLDEAVAVSRANADVVGLAYAIENRAMLAILEEDWERAAPLLREVFELCERHAVTAPLPEALSGAAAIASVRDTDQAARLFAASRALRFGQPVTPVEQRIEERFIASARDRADGIAWAAGERKARGMAFAEAVACGLRAVDERR
jgi:serine/threonine-protein kinase PknK